jgi:hypothetical protein
MRNYLFRNSELWRIYLRGNDKGSYITSVFCNSSQLAYVVVRAKPSEL